MVAALGDPSIAVLHYDGQKNLVAVFFIKFAELCLSAPRLRIRFDFRIDPLTLRSLDVKTESVKVLVL